MATINQLVRYNKINASLYGRMIKHKNNGRGWFGDETLSRSNYDMMDTHIQNVIEKKERERDESLYVERFAKCFFGGRKH